jgi:Septum formation inhibitor MinC, C-terminal domain
METEQGATTRPVTTSLIITSSIRSGQTIEFPDGDVTVIGSVGSGAEIVAGGSIHIYGVLRGRAIAGISGDRQGEASLRRHRPFQDLLAPVHAPGLVQDLDEGGLDRHARTTSAVSSDALATISGS